MKKLFILLLFILAALSVRPQGGIFAFAYDAKGKAEKGPPTGYKYETARQVFDALVAGQGDARRQPPGFVMKNSRKYVAWAMPEKAEIGLEELAYDICISFGADSLNALAALLSHELVHYYEKHEWRRHFVKEVVKNDKELSTLKPLENLEEGLKLEAQADYLGGFLAYSVGFDVHGVMPELLKKIYSEEGYDREEEIEGYPGLKDRIAMSEQSMEKLKQLQIVFETATYLNLLEEYDYAEKYYNYIIRDFQSRDIFNNAGVTALLSSLAFFPEKEIPYGLPVELDPKSRLHNGVTTRAFGLNQKEEREKRIQKALEYFERARSLDEHYVPSFINTAAAYVLLQDYEEANYWLRKAGKEDLNDKLSADVLVIRGVIAAQQKDSEGAKEWWRKAEELKNDLAAVNLNILENGPLKPEPKPFGFLTKKEQIDGLDHEQFLKQTPPKVMLDINDHVKCGYHERPNSRIYSHSVDLGKLFISIQVVDETFTGTSLEGIAVGDKQEKLLEEYDQPQRQVQTPEGAFLIYPARNMFFRTNHAKGVRGWGVYRTMERP